IEDIRRDQKPIYVGQGAQAALARRILCQYGVFGSMDEAREAFKPPTDPAALSNDLQQKNFDDIQDSLRAGEVPVAFLLTSPADFRDHLAKERGTTAGALHLLPIDRAEAIVEQAAFAEPAVLPWNVYNDEHKTPLEGRLLTFPDPHKYQRAPGDSSATK